MRTSGTEWTQRIQRYSAASERVSQWRLPDIRRLIRIGVVESELSCYIAERSLRRGSCHVTLAALTWPRVVRATWCPRPDLAAV